MKPDIKSKFEVARRELSLYNDVAASTVNTCVHEPVPGSRLYVARSSLTLYEAYASAVQRLASGLDHLAAILILWSNESIPHFACHTVTRGLLEASARAVWLLDPSISEDQRAARGLLERVEGLWNRYRFEHYDGPEPKQFLRYRLKQIQESATEAGLSIESFKGGQREGQPRSIGGETRPGSTQVIDSALGQVIGEGSDELGVYSLLSGFAHSDAFTLGLDTETVARHDGYEIRQSRPNLGLVVDLAVFAAAIHRGGLQLLIEAAGSVIAKEKPGQTIR